MLRLIQITDTHLFQDQTGTLHGTCTDDSLRKMFNYIDSLQLDFDAFICTGDLSQDESCLSYQHFLTHISRFNKKFYCLPGNHDDFTQLRKATELKGLTHLLDLEALTDLGNEWIIVQLDTTIKGKIEGEFSFTG